MKNATEAQKKLGLRIHAMAFVPTIMVLLVVNFLTGSPYWVVWVVLGWGIGLIAHWLVVSLQSPKAGNS